ncbi:hypothetical protein AeMF1_014084 [Aphanomyces euteiches]|nr:hypothetical protein AeMF1_014084 [Aphanomyces euteiches]KAH9189583.1 hypothetical protein AeNC1_008444 [Aphanomyces euteiches]
MAPKKKKSKKNGLQKAQSGSPKGKKQRMARLVKNLNETQIQFLQRAMLQVRVQELTDQVAALQQQSAKAKREAVDELADRDHVIQDLKSDLQRLEKYVESLMNEKAVERTTENEMHLTLMRTNARTKDQLAYAEARIADLKAQCATYQNQIEVLLTNQLHSNTLAMTNQTKDDRNMKALINQHQSILPSLLDALQEFPQSTAIQLDATTAIQHVIKDTKNVPVFLALRGINCIIDAMERHPSHGQLLLNDANILWKLTFSALDKLQEYHHRIFSVLLRALKRISLESTKQFCWLVAHIFKALLVHESLLFFFMQNIVGKKYLKQKSR